MASIPPQQPGVQGQPVAQQQGQAAQGQPAAQQQAQVATQPTPYDDLLSILKVTGLSNNAAAEFANNQGFTTMDDFVIINPTDTSEMVKMHNDNLSKQATTKRIYGLPTVKRLQAMIYKIRLHHFVGVPFTTDDWKTDQQIQEMVDEVEAEERSNDGKSEATEFEELKKPEQLDDQFEVVESGFKTVLSQITSSHGRAVTLDYLLLDYGQVAPPSASIAAKRNYAAASTANMQSRAGSMDNSKFFALLKKWGRNTKAWPTLKRFENTSDGRGAFLALRQVYLGEDHIETRLIQANRALEKSGDGALLYSGEGTGLRWSTYHALLQEHMEFVHLHRGGWSHRSMSERLLSGITGNAREQHPIKHGIEHVLQNIATMTFEAVVTFMGTKVSRSYADMLAQKSAREATRKVAESDTQHDDRRDGGGFGGRGRGFEGRGYGRGRGGFAGRGQWAGRGRGRGYGRDRVNPKYDGATEVKDINGVDTSDDKIFGSLPWTDSEVRTYTKNRRYFLNHGRRLNHSSGNHNNNNSRDIKQMIAEGVEQALKRQREDGEESEQGNKKQNGEKGGNMGSGMGKGAHKKG